jgi:hypothetical protein
MKNKGDFMREVIITLFILILSGCTLASPSDSHRHEEGFLERTALSHSPKHVRFDPNETIFVDNLLADRIKGKIKQALPNEDVKVLVTGNRIIVSSPKRDNEEIAGQIRRAVGKASEGRSLVVVTDEVYQLYKDADRNY